MTPEASSASGPARNCDLELDLMRHWPSERPRKQWIGTLGSSVALHVLFFFIAVQLPSFAVRTEPAKQVVVKRIPLYLPRDVLTQRAPTRKEISKKIDLSDLLAQQEARAQRAVPKPSVRKFEMPAQTTRQVAKAQPVPAPEPPKISADIPAAQVPGSITGLGAPTPPPPAPAQNPFQNIGADLPPSPHPTLQPPKATVQSAVKSLSQRSNGEHVVVSDDSPMEPLRPSPGSPAEAAGRRAGASVELQSDPQGADFKPYLAHILAIVRANWRRVIPESARMGTLRGRTTIEFIISRDGSIPKLVTADSSGSDPLDRAAVAGLSMSNPLPPLPADFKGGQVRLAFSFSYNMPSQ